MAASMTGGILKQLAAGLEEAPEEMGEALQKAKGCAGGISFDF